MKKFESTNPIRVLILSILVLFTAFSSSSGSDVQDIEHISSWDTTAIRGVLNHIDSLLDVAPQQALEYLQLLQPKMDRLADSPLKALYHFYWGHNLMNRGEYQQAVQEFIFSSRMAEQFGDKELAIKSENNVAVVYARMRDYDRSNRILKELLPDVLKYANNHLILMVYTNLANNLLFQEKFDSARYYYEQAFRYTQPGSFSRAAVEVNLAHLCVKTNDFPGARKYAFNASNFALKNQLWELYLEAISNIANSYIQEKNYPRVIEYCQKALPTARKYHLRLQLQNLYGNLATGYEGLQDFRKAYYYLLKYSNLRDSLFNEEMSRQINELNAKYETEKKDKEILRKKAELRQKGLIIRSLIIGTIIVIILSLVIWKLYLSQRRAYQMLVQKHMELVHLHNGKNGKKQNSMQRAHPNIPFTPGKLRAILKELEHLMHHEKVFKQPDITIEKLSSHLNIHSRYLSQLINEVYQQSFPNFINKLRVEEAIRLFSDPQYERYSIEGISQEVGFQSKSSFNSAFKKFTGVTPGYFRKEMKQMHPAEREAV